MTLKHTKFNIIIIFCIGILFNSCINYKKIKYIQNDSDNNSYEVVLNKIEPYRIQTNDKLLISVSSSDPKTNSLFNNQENIALKKILPTYTVNDSGCIHFPFIGILKLLDLNLLEANNLIQEALNKYFKETDVSLQLSGYNITILGEINNPGTINITEKQINIFQLIGLAGDINIMGNKKKVMILRKTHEKYKIEYIDLTNNHFLESEYFFLKPNDIIYIEPLRMKTLGFSTFPFSTIFQALSTTVIIYTLFR